MVPGGETRLYLGVAGTVDRQGGQRPTASDDAVRRRNPRKVPFLFDMLRTMVRDSGADRVVLVDMDGVLADFDGAVLEALPPHIPRVPRTNFYIARDYPEHKADVAAVYSHPEFFFNLKPVHGAIEGWQRLIDLGYQPRICTAPLTSNPRSGEGKLAWLDQHLVPHFGATVRDEAIVDKNKHAYAGVVLIDDRPAVDTGGSRAPWRHVVFDQPYNQLCTSTFRLHGWTDPDMALVLEHAAAPGGC